ncbi:MAG TPA: extracellular solute-binding protein, partial [Crenalkalicoccus sp.]|nr:extracellular solute-binding protein [Crenalkalicoccus sp.]
MHRRTLLAGAAAFAAAPAFAQTGRTRVVFWHAMNGALGEELNKLCAGFNGAQSETEVVPIFKGSYPETLTAAIAAWRAGQAPHLVQMFEVGTGSMLAAGPAVKQTWQLIQETGVAINPENYIAAVRGYYSLPDGRLASAPFNSSTAVLWLNKDALEKAGLDPNKAPATWPELITMAHTIKSKSAAPMPMTTAWFSWIQLEQFAAIHNIPYATKANGFEGLDTELKVNAPPFVKHLTRLMDMAKEGLFKYGGRDSAPDPLFYSGEAAMGFLSSGSRGDIIKNA